MPFSPIDPFTRIKPGLLITKYSDWIIFTLLLFFFWAVVGIALRKRFEESRHLRVLITVCAIILAGGTYYAINKGLLHFNIQGLGIFSTILLFIIIFFIIFGLIRGYGVHLSNALPIGFLLFYISIWVINPQLIERIQDTMPSIHLLLAAMFIVSVIKIITSFFQHSKVPSAKEFKKFIKPEISKETANEINEDLSEEKSEIKEIKKKAIKINKVEIKTIEELKQNLKQVIQILERNGKSLNQEEINQLIDILRYVYKKKDILVQGIIFFKKYIQKFQSAHQKEIGELRQRLEKVGNKQRKTTILEEITFQQRIAEILDFIKKYESRIESFTKIFNQLLNQAILRFKQNPIESSGLLKKALFSLNEMDQIYKKQNQLEKFIIKYKKKILQNLVKEKAP